MKFQQRFNNKMDRAKLEELKGRFHKAIANPQIRSITCENLRYEKIFEKTEEINNKIHLVVVLQNKETRNVIFAKGVAPAENGEDENRKWTMRVAKMF